MAVKPNSHKQHLLPYLIYLHIYLPSITCEECHQVREGTKWMLPIDSHTKAYGLSQSFQCFNCFVLARRHDNGISPFMHRQDV